MNNDWKEKGYIDEPVDGSVDLKKEIRRLCEEKDAVVLAHYYTVGEVQEVADFIGDSNIVDGVMHRDFLVSFSGVEFPCVDRGFAREESVQVVVRPEDIEVVSPVEGQLVGVVNDVIFKGVHFEMHVECEGREWLIHSTRACTPGETIGMRIGPNEIHIMSRSEG